MNIKKKTANKAWTERGAKSVPAKKSAAKKKPVKKASKKVSQEIVQRGLNHATQLRIDLLADRVTALEEKMAQVTVGEAPMLQYDEDGALKPTDPAPPEAPAGEIAQKGNPVVKQTLPSGEQVTGPLGYGGPDPESMKMASAPSNTEAMKHWQEIADKAAKAGPVEQPTTEETEQNMRAAGLNDADSE